MLKLGRKSKDSPDSPWFEWKGDTLLLWVKATPRAKQTQFEGVLGNRLKIRLNAPPVDGKANKALQIFLSKQFGVPRGRVVLLKGDKSREKQFEIRDPSKVPDELAMSLST